MRLPRPTISSLPGKKSFCNELMLLRREVNSELRSERSLSRRSLNPRASSSSAVARSWFSLRSARRSSPRRSSTLDSTTFRSLPSCVSASLRASHCCRDAFTSACTRSSSCSCSACFLASFSSSSAKPSIFEATSLSPATRILASFVMSPLSLCKLCSKPSQSVVRITRSSSTLASMSLTCLSTSRTALRESALRSFTSFWMRATSLPIVPTCSRISFHCMVNSSACFWSTDSNC
mmetsp:Transcript_6617/g.11514  ORF Transcript_6617/g.11514 Transcript_6617/m.11514 type:complete len:235 (+) Transcript_6617:356-1060(+)